MIVHKPAMDLLDGSPAVRLDKLVVLVRSIVLVDDLGRPILGLGGATCWLGPVGGTKALGRRNEPRFVDQVAVTGERVAPEELDLRCEMVTVTMERYRQ